MSSSTKTWLLAIPITLVVIGMATFGYRSLLTPEEPDRSSPLSDSLETVPALTEYPAESTVPEHRSTEWDINPTAPGSPQKDTSQLTPDEFSWLINRLLSSESQDHRALFISVRDPIAYIDELSRLRHQVAQGGTQNTPDPTRQTPDIRVADSGITESTPNEQFPALPARISLDVDVDSASLHGRHVLRWVNSETAEVEHMSQINIPGGDDTPLTVETGPLGGQTGAWHLEVYQARDGLPQVTRIPITVGSDHMATRRSQDP